MSLIRDVLATGLARILLALVCSPPPAPPSESLVEGAAGVDRWPPRDDAVPSERGDCGAVVAAAAAWYRALRRGEAPIRSWIRGDIGDGRRHQRHRASGQSGPIWPAAECMGQKQASPMPPLAWDECMQRLEACCRL